MKKAKCKCCKTKVKKSIRGRISEYCKNCSKHSKNKHGVMVNKNSHLRVKVEELKKRLNMYE